MKTKIYVVWYRLSSSLWFIPTLMVILAIILWYGMVLLDSLLTEYNLSFGWIFSGGIEGARSILSTIAGSIITVAGVVFSITIVVLSQSAGQFGPQLVKGFMQDKSTQIALGVFIATFAYSLLTLGSLRGQDGVSQSQAGTVLALVLALASIGVLIRFIHGMARSIQSNRIIASVVKEMNGSINRVFPAASGEKTIREEKAGDMDIVPSILDDLPFWVNSDRSGFIQSIGLDKLVQIAEDRDLIIRLQCNPGQFISWKGILVTFSAEHDDEKLSEIIQDAFFIGDERTTEQDIEFSLERLAMIAVRALSPGINDPYTASICIRWLGVMLCQLAERSFLDPYHYDNKGKVRVITKPVVFSTFTGAAFNEIRSCAHSPAIFIDLLENIDAVSRFVEQPDDRENLIQHARDIEFACRQRLAGSDLQRVEEKYLETIRNVENPSGIN